MRRGLTKGFVSIHESTHAGPLALITWHSINAVLPHLSTASTLAPCVSTSAFTVAVWPLRAANINAVLPTLSTVSTLAPCVPASAVTVAVWPQITPLVVRHSLTRCVALDRTSSCVVTTHTYMLGYYYGHYAVSPRHSMASAFSSTNSSPVTLSLSLLLSSSDRPWTISHFPPLHLHGKENMMPSGAP